MKRLLVLTLALAVTVPVAAQKMGQVNNGAPVVGSKIAMGDALTLEISHTSINFAKGDFLKNAKDNGQRGDRLRKRINDSAETAPLGDVKVTGDASIGGKKVAAGSYKLFFTVDKDAKWTMVMKSEAVRHEWLLDLKETKSKSTRLAVSVSAGEKDNTAILDVRFGNLEGTLPAEPAKADKPAEKPAEPSKN